MAISVGTSVKTAGATTTSLTLVIDSGVAAGDILVCALVNRDSTADPTVVDDDSGGNTWTKLKSQICGNAGATTVWWKRATSGTAGKTITASGFTGSCAGGVTGFSGVSGVANPFSQTTIVSDQLVGSGTPLGQLNVAVANSMVFLVLGDSDNDTNDITSEVATDPSTMTERYMATSTGGSDCALTLCCAIKTTSGNTGQFTWSGGVNLGVIAFALEPSAPSSSVSPSNSPSRSPSSSVSPSNSPSSSPSISPSTSVSPSVSPSLSASEPPSIWDKSDKHTSSFSNRAKNYATYTEPSKHSSTWVDRTKS